MQNKGYPTNWLYDLKQRNNIVSVIGKYIHLDKKGENYWACCPFHNEKTPSFAVNEDEGYYHCFGCKESGDVISFIMKYESCDFMEAVKILAKNANMEIPEFVGEKEIIQQKKTKEIILNLLEDAYKHYQENLYAKEAVPAQNYIKKRGFNKHDLEDFKIGYSINRNEIIDYLTKKKFTIAQMLEAGLIKTKNNINYDVQAGRLVFPIFNSFNECIGFSSRLLENADFAKYINTADTLVFKKGKVVFGINLVKKLKQQSGLDRIIVVEGQIDVIAMHRAGFKSTVACMGTALTKENAHELKKLSNNITLCFDGDYAGVKATIKSIDILKEEGFNILVVALPGGHDPDEIIKEKGKEYLKNLIDNALPVTDYLINVELQNYDLSKADEKGEFATAVLKHISKIGSNSEEEPYLDKLRDLTSIPIDILRRDLDKIKNGQVIIKNNEKSAETVLITRENGNIRAIKFILSSLIFRKEFVDKKIDYRKLLPKYKEIIDKAEEGVKISSYYDYFDVDNMPMLKDCINLDFSEYKGREKQYFQESVWNVAYQELLNKRNKIIEEFKNCQSIEQRNSISQQLNIITKAINQKSLEDFYVR